MGLLIEDGVFDTFREQLKALQERIIKINPELKNWEDPSVEFDPKLSQVIFADPKLYQEPTEGLDFVNPEDSDYPNKVLLAIWKMAERALNLTEAPTGIFDGAAKAENLAGEVANSKIRPYFTFMDESWVPKIIDEKTYKAGLALQPFLDYLIKEKPSAKVFTPKYGQVKYMAELLAFRLERFRLMYPNAVETFKAHIKTKREARDNWETNANPLIEKARKIHESEIVLKTLYNEPLKGDSTKIIAALEQLEVDSQTLPLIQTKLTEFATSWIEKITQKNLPDSIKTIPFLVNPEKKKEVWLELLQVDYPYLELKALPTLKIHKESIHSTLKTIFDEGMGEVVGIKATLSSFKLYKEHLQQKMRAEETYGQYKTQIEEITQPFYNEIEYPVNPDNNQTPEQLQKIRHSILTYQETLIDQLAKIRLVIPALPEIPELTEIEDYKTQFDQLSATTQKELFDKTIALEERMAQIPSMLLTVEKQLGSAHQLVDLSKKMDELVQSFTEIILPKGVTKEENGNLSFTLENNNLASLRQVEMGVAQYRLQLEKQAQAITQTIDSLPRQFPEPKDESISHSQGFLLLKESTVQRLEAKKQQLNGLYEATIPLEQAIQSTKKTMERASAESRNEAIAALEQDIKLNFQQSQPIQYQLNVATAKLMAGEKEAVKIQGIGELPLKQIEKELIKTKADYQTNNEVLQEAESYISQRTVFLREKQTQLESAITQPLNKTSFLQLLDWDQKEIDLINSAFSLRTYLVSSLKSLVSSQPSTQDTLAPLLKTKLGLIASELAQQPSAQPIDAGSSNPINLYTLNENLPALKNQLQASKLKIETLEKQYSEGSNQLKEQFKQTVQPLKEKVSALENKQSLMAITDAQLREKEGLQHLDFKLDDFEKLSLQLEEAVKVNAEKDSSTQLNVNAFKALSSIENKLDNWKDAKDAFGQPTVHSLLIDINKQQNFLEREIAKQPQSAKLPQITALNEKRGELKRAQSLIIKIDNRIAEFKHAKKAANIERELDEIIAVSSKPEEFKEKIAAFKNKWENNLALTESNASKLKDVDRINQTLKTPVSAQKENPLPIEGNNAQNIVAIKNPSLMETFFGKTKDKLGGVFGKYMEERAKEYWVSDFMQTIASMTLFFFYKTSEDQRWDYLQNDLRPAVLEFETDGTNSDYLQRIITQGLKGFPPRSDSSNDSLRSKLKELQTEIRNQIAPEPVLSVYQSV